MNISILPAKQISHGPVNEAESKLETSRSHAPVAFLLLLLLWSGDVQAANSSGLWVGEVTLNKVNETVVGFNAANQVVAPDPAVTTPVASPAHLRIILHVDSANNVR